MTDTSTATDGAVSAPDALRRAEMRRPGQHRIDRTVAARAESAPPSVFRRLFGGSPIGAAERDAFDAARGERIVGRELDALPAEWIVLHSLPSPGGGGDLDHVVVGPGGLVALTTRFVAGDVAFVAEDYVLARGQRVPFARAAVSAMRRAAALAGPSLPPSVAVRGVVVIAGPRTVRRGARARLVEVRAAENVREWLESLPPVLTADDVKRVAVRMAESVEAGPGPTPLSGEVGGAGDHLFFRLERDTAVARRIRALWRVAGCAALAGGVWVSFAQLPAWLAFQIG
jgi:hypothetical protein